MPTTTGFTIQRNGDPPHFPPPCKPPKAVHGSVSRVGTAPLDQTLRPLAVPSRTKPQLTMPCKPPASENPYSSSQHPTPAPDAFPSTSTWQEHAHGRNKRPTQLWDPDRLRRSSRRRRHRSPSPETPEPAEIEEEIIVAPPRLLRPLPRRFGIFCTGKNSMHQPVERVGRPRLLRPKNE